MMQSVRDDSISRVSNDKEREREREREKEENERDRDEWETKCRVSGQERHTCGHVKAAW